MFLGGRAFPFFSITFHILEILMYVKNTRKFVKLKYFFDYVLTAKTGSKRSQQDLNIEDEHRN